MAGQQVDEETKQERLKAAVWYSVGQTVDHVSTTQDVNATPQFIGSLSELVYAHIDKTARDLEAFARHAGRTTINTTDILLLGRNNEGLDEVLQAQVEKAKARS